jgi:hypothetical protein
MLLSTTAQLHIGCLHMELEGLPYKNTFLLVRERIRDTLRWLS